MYEIGNRIKLYRERIGLSQKEFAVQINQNNATVSNWERGLTRPNVDVLADICMVLKVSPDELLGLEQRISAEVTEHEMKIIEMYRSNNKAQSIIDILMEQSEERE